MDVLETWKQLKKIFMIHMFCFVKFQLTGNVIVIDMFYLIECTTLPGINDITLPNILKNCQITLGHLFKGLQVIFNLYSEQFTSKKCYS